MPGVLSEELLDVLTPEGEPTGETKPRSAVHRDGDWHRSFHLWIVKDSRFVLFQRRARGKDLEPLKLDVSVGGHFAAGETLLDVLREAEEELGLKLTVKDVEYLLTRRAERRYQDATDREIQEVYVTACDWPLERYDLNKDEVYVLYELPIDRALQLYRDGDSVPAAGFDAYRRTNNALLFEADIIEQAREDVVRALKAIQLWLGEAEDNPRPLV